MLFRHGAYYYTGKPWVRLGNAFGPALTEYAKLVGERREVQTIKDAMWGAIEHARTRKHKRPISEATLASYTNSAMRLEPVFGHIGLDELEADDVARYIVEGGKVQHNRDRAFLSIAYTYARVLGGYRGSDPTKRLYVRVEERPRDRYVTDEELDSIIAKSGAKLACMTRFLELTGMRQGDMCKLKIADLDDEGFTYWNSKSKKMQGLERSDELDAVIEEAMRLWRRFGREWLFESRPKGRHAKRGIGPYTPSGLRALWRRARTKAGLKDVRLHDIRAKASSDLPDDATAQGLLGHADGKTTRRHYRRKLTRSKPVR